LRLGVCVCVGGWLRVTGNTLDCAVQYLTVSRRIVGVAGDSLSRPAGLLY